MSVQPVTPPSASLLETIQRDGIVVVHDLVAGDTLDAMQRAFDDALQHPSWNTWHGYEQTTRQRRMVEHILTLDPAFQELALHPLLREVMGVYIGPGFVLTELRGWETIATDQDFHGWHNDAWYDHALPEVPRELKLGFYLTDVESGHFSYIRGSQVGNRHRHWNDREVAPMRDRILDVKGPAGTGFIFDTAGIHRQSVPVLKPRRALMYNYHDPAVPLQELDVRQYRYAPLHLNAAFLGGLSTEEQRVLGFGDRSTYRRGYRPPRRFGALHDLTRVLLGLRLRAQEIGGFLATGSAYALRKLRGDRG